MKNITISSVSAPNGRTLCRRKAFSILFFAIIVFSMNLHAADNRAHWLCYPGEFGIWTHRYQMSLRTERNESYPSFWRVDSPYGIVTFMKDVSLSKAEKVLLKVDGSYYIMLNNGIEHGYDSRSLTLPAGKYTITLRVQNFHTLPSFYMRGETVFSDNTWRVNSLNNDDTEAEVTVFDDPDTPPSSFHLQTRKIFSTARTRNGREVLIDYGRETFAYPVIHGAKGQGDIHLYYGESKEEAMGREQAETYDIIDVAKLSGRTDTLPAKAFRYILVTGDASVHYDSVTALYEYLPLKRKGSFECSDPLLNKIYNTSYYTLELNTRYCHLDGIKRDRWVWSGDAYQSYLMNFYTFFDEDVNRRTLWGLRGHEPVNSHINTILDYSFYWILGVYSHYLYTGDSTFVRHIYPRMLKTMDFCIGRLNKDSIAEGCNGDWVFVDWAPMDKSGELSFEQLLFLQCLKTMNLCAGVAGDKTTAGRMEQMYRHLYPEFDRLFWSDSKKAYLHQRVNNVLKNTVTRYTNIFSILFNTVDETRKEDIKRSVILNDSILAITTPYMKFYELAALCEIGEQKQVIDFVKNYWGGMLKLGATSIWEAYDPTQPVEKSYEMYGRPFGKSLCHAWGANPVYLFGRYFLGVRPLTPGYKTYEVRPQNGGLNWMKGTVPTPQGNIGVAMTKNSLTVTTSASAGGTLYFQSKRKPKANTGQVTKIDATHYSLSLTQPNTRYEVRY